jgi:hypothetical protein
VVGPIGVFAAAHAGSLCPHVVAREMNHPAQPIGDDIVVDVQADPDAAARSGDANAIASSSSLWLFEPQVTDSSGFAKCRLRGSKTEMNQSRE